MNATKGLFDSLGWMLFKHYLLSTRSSALIRMIGWLCMVGVGVGVASMIVVLSVMNGFDGAIRKRLLSVEPHIVVSVGDEKIAASEAALQNLLNDYQKSHKDLVTKNVFEIQDVILRTADGLYGGAVAKGLDPSSLQFILKESQKNKNQEQKSKSFGLTRKEKPSNEVQRQEAVGVELTSNEALIGIDLAQSMGLFEGDILTVVAPESLLLPPGEMPRYDSLIIKSIVRTNIPEVDGGMVYYNRLTGMKRLAQTSGKEYGFELRLSRPNDFETLKQTLEKSQFKVESWHDRNAALFHSLKMEKLAMGLFLALSVLIASFSILTVLVLLVTHKRIEMGVLMTLGLSQTRTRNAFATVGCLVAGLGLFGGFSVGLFICWILDTFPLIELPDIYYDTQVPVDVDPLLLAGLFVASLVISVTSSWVPAFLSTRASVVDLLRPSAET
jgi:lipoprotein-releasing system permease protein